MKTKVSVVVPVYNVEKYIGGCLESLLNQTLKEIEIICINDGSTDNSLDIIREYAAKDSRIKVINKKNEGRSLTRNVGLKEVTSPYVMFCDSDDGYELDACEKMVKAMDSYMVDVAICGIKIVYEAHDEIKSSDEAYYRLKFYGKNYVDDNLIMKTDASVCNKIFRMDLVKKYKISFPEKLNNEDYYFYGAYMSIARTCYFINQKLYKYIRHEGSIMSDNFDRNIYSPDHLMVAKRLFSFYKKTGFIKKHTNLFWTQFSESFWFSRNHSAKKYHNKIDKIAKKFIEENYEKNLPSDKKVKNRINIIVNYNVFYRLGRNIGGKLKRVYSKINIAYRQQDYINAHLNGLYGRIENLSERLDSIEKRKKV